MSSPLWTFKEVTGMHLELTDKCNAGCPMCPRFENDGTVNPQLELTDISLENFMKWFPPEILQNFERVWACGNYGDAIVARDCLEIFQYMRASCGASLTLHTNGSARSTSWWNKLGQAMMKEDRKGHVCIFAIDGLSDTHHLYRRHTSFDKIIENAKAFIAGGGDAECDFIVFEHNEHQVEEARQLVTELGFSKFNIKHTSRWNKRDDDGVGYREVYDRTGKILYHLRQPKQTRYHNSNAAQLKAKVSEVEVKFHSTRPKYDPRNIRVFDPETNGYLEVEHQQLEVSCRAQDVNKGGSNRLNEIFLSATGHVFPCCFLGGIPWKDGYHHHGTWIDPFVKQIADNGGLDSLSLHKHSLQEIIESEIYASRMTESFAVGSEMRSKQCSSCCGKEWNGLVGGELGAVRK